MATRKRGNGEGGIYRDAAKGRWVASVSLPGELGKKRKRVKRYARSKSEAVAKLRELTGADPAAPIVTPGTVNVATVIDRFLHDADRRLAPTTAADYRQQARLHLLPRFANIRAGKLAPDAVQAAMDEMRAAGDSASVRRKCLTVLRQAYALAKREGRASHDPTEGITRPRTDTKVASALSSEDSRRLIQVLEREYHGPLLTVLLGTGLRIGEVMGLEWKNVRTDPPAVVVQSKVVRVEGKTHVGPPKTAAGRRYVALPAFAAAALAEQLKRNMAAGLAANPLCFPSRTGTYRRRCCVGKALTRILNRAEIRHVRVHDLRHTHATLLTEGGESAVSVQIRLGHTKVGTTLDLYGHATASMQASAAANIDAALNRPHADAEPDAAAG